MKTRKDDIRYKIYVYMQKYEFKIKRDILKKYMYISQNILDELLKKIHFELFPNM